MNQAISRILLEEEEDDDILLRYYISMERNPSNSIFISRKEEGTYRIFIKKHLQEDDEKFRSFCRFNKKLFNFILSFVCEELAPQIRNCISAEEKLFLTLRYVFIYSNILINYNLA